MGFEDAERTRREGPPPVLPREAALSRSQRSRQAFSWNSSATGRGYQAGLVGTEASLRPALDIEREAQAAGAWSKWFTRFLRETVGMMGTTKVFRLVGRTFPRMARDAGSMRRCTMPALGSPEAVASGGATGEASGPRRCGGQDGEGRTGWPALRHSENSQRSVAIATGGHTAALLAPRPGRMLAVAHANGCHERVAVDSRARPDACRARRGQRSRRGRKRHQECTQGTSADGSSQGGEGLQHRLPHRLVMVRLTNTGPA